MQVDYAGTEHPLMMPLTALKAVWVLHADPSYKVSKRREGRTSIIALKTTGGTGKVVIEEAGELQLSPGTLIFFRHDGVRHYGCSGENWDFRWFEFHCSGTMPVPLNKRMYIDVVKDEEMLSYECLRTLQDNTAAGRTQASAAFSLLLSRWLSRLAVENEADPYKKAMDDIIRQMHERLSENLTIAEMAKKAGLCERRFHDIFVQATGVPPKKFFTQLKIKYAEELLTNTPLAIGLISERLGFASQFHFCTAFKRVHGKPPSEYRRGK